MKKLIAVVMTLLLVALIPVSVFAYKSDPDLRVTAVSEGIPEGTVYIDVLLPKEAFGDRFVEFNDGYTIDSSYKFIAGLSQEPFESVELYADDEISQYRLDDYYSFLAHFDGAQTEFGTEQLYTYHDYYYGSDKEFDCTAEFYIKNPESDLVYYSTMTVFSRAKTIKLAYIGEQGNILLMTEPFSVKDRAFIAKFFESAVADGENVKAQYYISPFIALPEIVLIAVIITVVSVVAIKVRGRKKMGELPPVEQN